MIEGSFPYTRLRRNRQFAWQRELVAENHLNISDLILPIFLAEGKNTRQKIDTLPDVFRFSIDLAIKQAKAAKDLGISAIMLFPLVDQDKKTIDGKEATNPKNLICRAVSAIKKAVPNIGIICDVALDPYTSHGHDGVVCKKTGSVLNDETIEVLCKQSLVQAKAGCDIIAPSDMMDGRIMMIRDYLDQNAFQNVAIMSYAIKYASSFYGPFRSAVGSDKNLAKADKKNYQMDFRNSSEAMREIALDVEEGADTIIIKPGMPYLDIIKMAKDNFNIPIIAYQVSGEFAMLKYAGLNKALDFDRAYLESLMAFKRAGARSIITYGAIEAANFIKDYK
jgi:porphobilinogen synthase